MTDAPAGNERVLGQMIFVREDQTYPDFKVLLASGYGTVRRLAV